MATETSVDYDRTKELKQFDDTKAGVKGLVDAGILNIPKIFVRPSEDLAADELNSSQRHLIFNQTTLTQSDVVKGVRKHADAGILTVLLQNHIGGLQVLHDDQWFDVHPIRGGLVINVGDLLQVLSNEKFKSVKHRAISNHVGPRISVPCFFSGHASLLDKPFGPIKDLQSEANPPRYKEFLLNEYFAKFFSSSLDDDKLPLDYYKL
ncbi:hypothetical protein ES288_A09G266300v1 [Gossypium darwinii]|uniref:Fe2OG dioxygenase domain-containing protein n=1 Tax=Gossypium darwinii TaxID=34276 RepID=A0A5D2FDW4_GOSDA|nr:hypothetical protein ES288_A09G266300v1 [Gossypium darwinii]